MYENSKHANWLLVTLLVTLLLSSLTLGYLLSRSSVFANPSLLTQASLAESSLVTGDSAKPPPTTSTIQVPQVKTEPQPTQVGLEPKTASLPTPNPTTEVSNRLPLSLLDSQDYLEQAAIVPNTVVPLASLAANQSTTIPKTTAPAALTLQGLADTPIHSKITKKSAWLYAGQYQNGKWSLLGLDLDLTTLPQAHQTYKLTWGAKVRSAPPGQRMSTGSANLADSIGYLAEGSSIQVLSVKQSGKNGHIWLEIVYGE